MLVAAGAGVLIAKHGNRSVTSRCGSADVLEALGVRIDIPPREVKRTIEEIGIGFMFAPVFHGSMKRSLEPRREIGVRTVFNVLGPLTNPAGAQTQVLGVYDHRLTEKLALVLDRLGCQRALVVNGMNGLDEISTLGRTRIAELKKGSVETYTISPEDYGIPRVSQSDISGREAVYNARVILGILQGEKGPCRDIVQLNAAAAIFVSRKSVDLKQGLELASEAIDSGSGLAKLRQLVKATNGDIERLEALEQVS
jgi:anthranilate phosphoribosyltransferase